MPPDCSKLTAQLLTVGLVLSLLASGIQAEIFHYTDAQGRKVFTDRPSRDPGYHLVWHANASKIDSGLILVPHRPLPNPVNPTRTWRGKGELAPLIQQVAQATRLNPGLLHAVVQAESAYNPQARSRAGAMGLMQLMPATARRYGVADVWDATQNLTGGARYLRYLLDLFNNDLRLALAAYNAGEGTIFKYGGRIPPYPETREYVRRVIGNFRSEVKEQSS